MHGKNTGNMERNYYKKITKDWETDVAVIWKNSILTILLIWISYFLSTIFFMLINVILFIYSLLNKKDLLIDYYFLKLMKLFEWHKQAFSLLNKAKTFYYSGRLHQLSILNDMYSEKWLDSVWPFCGVFAKGLKSISRTLCTVVYVKCYPHIASCVSNVYFSQVSQYFH